LERVAAAWPVRAVVRIAPRVVVADSAAVTVSAVPFVVEFDQMLSAGATARTQLPKRKCQRRSARGARTREYQNNARNFDKPACHFAAMYSFVDRAAVCVDLALYAR
jgi:hypothetical protein